MDEMTQIKDKLVKHLGKTFDERERVDPELADAIKDLAEAAYYCKVTEAMGKDEPMGYQRNMGYMPMGYYEPMGYQMRDARGRYAYGDSVEAVRNILAGATPEEKERIKAEMRNM
jgi:hypothetical protein